MNDRLILSEQERNSPLWNRIKTHYETRLNLLRAQNDNDKSAEDTAKNRGRIAECKVLLALDNPTPAQVATDE